MSIFQIQGPWAGRLAVVSRPRGGDWIDDEVRAWKDGGLNAVVSLLTEEEQREFELSGERGLRETRTTVFFIPNQRPRSAIFARRNFTGSESGREVLASGQNVGIHCRQSIGRSGMMAACLLVMAGSSAQAAMESVSNSRGLTVPETPEQIEWVSEFEREFAPSVIQR